MSNALDIPRKTDLTSRYGLQSNDLKISWLIASNWFIEETEGRNSDWFGFKSLSFKIKLQIPLKITFSNILPKIFGNKEMVTKKLVTKR